MILATFLALPSRAFCQERPKELFFGMSAAFTGANGELGIEFYRGLSAYLNHLNNNGGANGWQIKIMPANDGYNPAPCFQNTINFLKNRKVFALFSYVGTPTTTSILPLLQKFHKDNVYLLAPFTGALPLRTPPFGQYVYNLRASYFEETAGLVDLLVSAGRTRIAVFYQSDAYGRTGWDGVRRALQKKGLNIVGEAAYERGARFQHDFTEQVEYLLKSQPDAIICIGTYASQGGFIRDLRDRGVETPVAGLSFANCDKMLELLTQAGNKSGTDYTHNLLQSQVVPSYEDISLPAVRLYRKLMTDYKGIPAISSSGYRPRRFSYVSLEGFLNGVLLGEIIKRMSDDPRRERIPETIGSITNFDLGIGENLNFSQGRHQGLNKVYLTTVRDGLFKPVIDRQRWRK